MSKYRTLILPLGGGGGSAPTLQEKVATPSVIEQSITPDAGYDGLSSVEVEAVTSDIDENITADNIKSGVTILGVEGTLIEPSGSTSISYNGTYDVTEYATAVVSVINGEYDFFCITANAESNINFSARSGYTLYYSTDDKTTWNSYSDNNLNTLATLAAGEKMYCYGLSAPCIQSQFSQFNITGDVSLSGRITTLADMYGTDNAQDNAFNQLFAYCEGITDISGLVFPLYISSYCFYRTFYENTNLVTLPDTIGAASLQDYAFYSTFENCYSIQTVPVNFIKDVQLLNYMCFYHTFYNCSSITSISKFPIVPGGTYQYYDETYGYCTSLTSIDLSYIEGKVGQEGVVSLGTDHGMFPYSGITDVDLSGVTSLGSYGLKRFLLNCENLVSVDISNIETASGSYSLEEFVKGCPLLTSIDLTKLTQVGSGCCNNMCNGDTSLSEIKIGVTDWDTNSFVNYVQDVAASGTFYKTSTASIPVDSTNGIPTGWTVVDGVVGTIDETNMTISLSTNMANATIYYTTDDTTPTTASNVYSSPISIPSGSNYYAVKAFATDGTSETLISTIAYNNYFYIEALEDDTQISIYRGYQTSIDYSTDKYNWTTIGEYNSMTISLPTTGDKVYFRNSSSYNWWNLGGCSYNDNNCISTNSGTIKAGGCLSTLCYSTSKPNQVIGYNTWCYNGPCGFGYLFNNNQGLIDASDIIFDISQNDRDYETYKGMFYNCSNLQYAPTDLANITSVTSAFDFTMAFYECASLTSLDFSGLTVIDGSSTFNQICYNCVSLTSIDFSNLAEVHYSGNFTYAFYGCTSLTSVDFSNLTVVDNPSFQYTFQNCTNLAEMKIGVNTWSTDYFNMWMDNVAATGDFYCDPDLSISTDDSSGIPTGWTRQDLEVIDYFYIKNEDSGINTFTLTKTGTPSSTDLSYSTDKNTWTDIHDGGSVALAEGQKLYLRSSTGLSSSTSDYYKIDCSHNYSVGGDVATIVDYTDPDNVTILPDYCMVGMFGNNTTRKVVDISHLNFHNITELGQQALYATFQGNNITQLPDMSHITTLNSLSLGNTFSHTSITSADLSNITTINKQSTDGALRWTFANCSQLVDVWAPNVSTWDSTTYGNYWLQNVAASGVLHLPSGLCVGSGTGCIPENSVSGVPTGWTTQNY